MSITVSWLVPDRTDAVAERANPQPVAQTSRDERRRPCSDGYPEEPRVPWSLTIASRNSAASSMAVTSHDSLATPAARRRLGRQESDVWVANNGLTRYSVRTWQAAERRELRQRISGLR
jgi:hypothetical protein